MPEIKRDTASFGPRQFFVEGYNGPMFTTREDAEAALTLGNRLAIRYCRELKDIIQEALDNA
jgi:hypothetical protein